MLEDVVRRVFVGEHHVVELSADEGVERGGPLPNNSPHSIGAAAARSVAEVLLANIRNVLPGGEAPRLLGEDVVVVRVERGAVAVEGVGPDFTIGEGARVEHVADDDRRGGGHYVSDEGEGVVVELLDDASVAVDERLVEDAETCYDVGEVG